MDDDLNSAFLEFLVLLPRLQSKPKETWPEFVNLIQAYERAVVLQTSAASKFGRRIDPVRLRSSAPFFLSNIFYKYPLSMSFEDC